MAKVTNKEIINAVLSEMPITDADLLKGATTPEQQVEILNNYPTVRNSFVNTLQNKVGKTMIFDKIYTNPLKDLKRGLMALGDTIEELMVHMAEMKNFGEHWESGGASAEADLIRMLKPKVTALYITRNFDKKFKTTVSDKELRKAFFNEEGLSKLVQQIVVSISNKKEYAEFTYSRDTLLNLVSDLTVLDYTPEKAGDTYSTIQGVGTTIKQGAYCVDITDTNEPLTLLEAIRASVGDLGFMSDKYNFSKVTTFSNPQDLILMLTPQTKASIDVKALASLFNVNLADINTKTLLVDKMPSGIAGASAITSREPEQFTGASTITKQEKTVHAILFDKDLIQIHDTYQGSGTFFNPEGQYTNHFANVEGIFAHCLFANMVVFYS